MVTNLRYADDVILLATLEAELQESVDRPTPRPTQPQIQPTPLHNVDKTKVMASDGLACRIGLFIENKQVEQVDTFP